MDLILSQFSLCSIGAQGFCSQSKTDSTTFFEGYIFQLKVIRIFSFLGTFCFLFSVPLIYNYNCNSQPALFLFLFLQRELYCQIQRRILAHTQRRVNTITDTKEIYESYSFFVLLGKRSLSTQPKSTIIQISPGFRLSRRLCQIPPSYCTTENSFFCFTYRLFSLYPSGGGCQLLSNWLFAPQRIPTWDISTAIAKSRSGDPAPTYPERFRIQAFSKKIFHIFLFFAEKFEIGRSSCLFQLF